MQIASLGLRAKTATAIAIALNIDDSPPSYIARWGVALHDPAVPATSQPHHEVMELPWESAKSAVQGLERQIANVATEAVAKIVNELRANGFALAGVAIVGSPDRNLEHIGNPHIRAHAAEGILFRRVLEVAACNHSLKWQSFSDRGFDEVATAELAARNYDVKAVMTSIGHAGGKPWRADERIAAMAAWLVLNATSGSRATLSSTPSIRRRTRH
jgi:hypothetical protein